FYQLIRGPGTAFEDPAGVSLFDFPDGRKQTLLVVEAGEPVLWTKPADLPYDPTGPLPKLGGLFAGGFHATFADGTGRFIPAKTGEGTKRALITRNGGEPVDRDRLP